MFDTVATKIDCVVELAYVEELLGGRSLDEQLDDPRAGGLIAGDGDGDGDGDVIVLTLSNAMHTALTSSP